MISKGRFTSILLCGAAAGGLILATAAQAADSGATLDEVVVTAQRTETSLQKTPIAVTAYNATALQQRGVTNLMDLGTFAPNLSIGARPGAGASRASFALRGMGVNAENGSAAVGVYVDEVYFPAAWGNALGLLDTERVEILRGPQGTLFGRNTIAGAVQYVSVKPSKTFGGYAQATGGNLDRAALEGALNVPLGDQLAARLSLSSDHQGGYVTDDYNGIKRGAVRTNLGRLQLRWTPTDKLTVDLKADYAEQKTNGRAVAIVGANPLAQLAIAAGATQFGPNGVTSTVTPAYLTTRKYHFAGYNSPDYFRAEQASYTGVVGYQLTDSIRFKSISAYSRDESLSVLDVDLTPLALLAGSRGRTVDKAFSQELQFTGQSFSDRLKWTAGLYYYDSNSKKTGQYNGIGRLPPSPLSDNLDKVKSTALYGQATYSITTRISVTGGLRYSSERLRSTNLGGGTPFPPPLALPTPYSQSNSYDDTSPQVGVNYQLTEDAMLYAKAAKGFRAGGVTLNETLVSLNGRVLFRPETAWTYEAGARLEFMNRRLRVNPTIFFTDWKDIQFNQLNITPVGPAISTLNAGDAHIKGAELEAQWAATDRLQFTASASYLDSHYTRVGNITLQVFPFYDQNGQPILLPNLKVSDPLQQSPKFKFSVGGRYVQPVSDIGRVTGSLDYGWTDKQMSSVTESDAILIKAHGVLNGRLAYQPIGDRWSIAVYGTNLLNEYYLIGGGGFGRGYTVGFDEADPARPREYGVTLRAQF